MFEAGGFIEKMASEARQKVEADVKSWFTDKSVSAPRYSNKKGDLG
jgi:hypothetical protein